MTLCNPPSPIRIFVKKRCVKLSCMMLPFFGFASSAQALCSQISAQKQQYEPGAISSCVESLLASDLLLSVSLLSWLIFVWLSMQPRRNLHKLFLRLRRLLSRSTDIEYVQIYRDMQCQ